ncbi:glycerate kinase [Nocardioides speluncae]|uniref:glycerate kinase n=1 Tax=Nocardioides speluncae TaxID=2670337 RepID=UPI001F0BD4F0|nr:glycerate kinase [Nocardioides speluncae]
MVLAADKFKGSLTAAEVGEALRRGIQRADPSAEVVRVRVADGGDGTLDAFVAAGFEQQPVTVTGPTGERVRTAYARRGEVAVVELADASGLSRLGAGPAPLRSSTCGTGEVALAAIRAGCRELVIGIGGSASTDGGAGLVTALGARILDARGESVPPGGIGLLDAASLDLGPLRELLSGVTITLASDVDNPLLGSDGAAAVYAPQKGATPADVEVLERALTRWADLVAATTGADLRDAPGAGAAGGAGFGALALLGATMRSGADTVLDLVGYDDALAGADLVVTGEGSVDEQSLRGKAPFAVLERARRRSIPVVFVCGRTSLVPESLTDAGVARLWALTDREPDLARCITEAASLLEEVGAELAGWDPR